jgi:hypothetical protein
MREAPSEFDLCGCDLAIVAKALAGGRDMNEIGLMRDIAKRTVAGPSLPEGLRRPRTGPYGPTKGRA